MNSNPQIQALLRQGLLPLLMKKFGATGPLAGGGGKPQSQPTGQPPPQSTQAQSGGQPQPGGMSVSEDPMSKVGNFGAPTPQPIADVNSLQQLIMGFHSRKQQKQQAEAANAAQSLMQAIEGAKASGDWTPAYDILHENEKLFNKVYKGWLQKAESQKKQAQGSEKQDPDTQGFEQGVSAYMQKKQGGKGQPQSQGTQAGPPPKGSAPSTLGGYYLPGASPTQAAQQQDVSAQRQLQAQGMLPPGVAKTQAEIDKAEAEKAKAHAEIITAAKNVQKAQFESQKAEAELKLKMTEQATAEKKGQISLDIEKEHYLTAQANRDKASYQLQRAKLLAQGASQPKINQATKLKLEAAERTKIFIDGIVGQDRDLTDSDVQALQNMLKDSGAQSLANGIRATSTFGWFKKGSADSKSLQKAFDIHYDALKASVGTQEKPKSEADAGDDEEDDDTEDTPSEPKESEPMEGDVVDGYRFKGGDPANKANWEQVKKP